MPVEARLRVRAAPRDVLMSQRGVAMHFLFQFCTPILRTAASPGVFLMVQRIDFMGLFFGEMRDSEMTPR
ncbi:MAG TPA: hypothetical protein VMJ11_12205 [Paraburkholderia sp.]|uniref:hypothetical protein n=1 Tax=Paraburkholderia sp. TaxID=1926495 RepID=UPI002D0377AA|nr:hypothetical protein [Paraburkholderia sp.]HTR07391.1 hypothetical protein [Paraburkholderia sp.]